MDVLVVESESRAADTAIDALTAAGHTVLRCHESGARSFPCNGLDPGHCPLEQGTIQVAVTVRGKVTTRPSPLEDGITCSLRRRIPVVVAGKTAINPFARFPVTDIAQHDVVAACERAALCQPEHEVIALAALHQTLRHAGDAAEGHVSVARTRDGLVVTLFVADTVVPATRKMAAVRVAGAVRAYDPYAPRIDVGFEPVRGMDTR